VGDCSLGKKKYEVFVARLPDDLRAVNTFHEIRQTGRRIVLIGETPLAIERLPHSIPVIIPLPAVTVCVENGIGIDPARFAELVHEWEEMVKDRGGNRDELKQWMLGVIDNRLRHGTTHEIILALYSQGKKSREIELELGKRGIEMDHSTICRIIDAKKRSYRLAGVRSSASVVREESSQPRDTRGRPRPDAQPEEEE